MIVRYSLRARSDLESIRQYLDERNPQGARNVLQEIYAAIEFIKEHPDGSSRTQNPNIRATVIRRYRYRIFYSVTADTIEVLHIRHTSRRPWIAAR